MALLEKLYPEMRSIDEKLIEQRVADIIRFSSQLLRVSVILRLVM